MIPPSDDTPMTITESTNKVAYEMMLDHSSRSRSSGSDNSMKKLDAIKGAGYFPLVPNIRLVCIRIILCACTVCTDLQRNSA